MQDQDSGGANSIAQKWQHFTPSFKVQLSAKIPANFDENVFGALGC